MDLYDDLNLCISHIVEDTFKLDMPCTFLWRYKKVFSPPIGTEGLCKLCRPRSAATEYGVLSGSAFANHTMGLTYQNVLAQILRKIKDDSGI